MGAGLPAAHAQVGGHAEAGARVADGRHAVGAAPAGPALSAARAAERQLAKKERSRSKRMHSPELVHAAPVHELGADHAELDGSLLKQAQSPKPPGSTHGRSEEQEQKGERDRHDLQAHIQHVD